jgi:hypothetical protein
MIITTTTTRLVESPLLSNGHGGFGKRPGETDRPKDRHRASGRLREHWVHLRTTNPIESTFATVRHRTHVTKGPGSRAAGLAMAFKLTGAAQGRWRAASTHLAALVRAGATFINGKHAERPAGTVAAWPIVAYPSGRAATSIAPPRRDRKRASPPAALPRPGNRVRARGGRTSGRSPASPRPHPGHR